VALNNLAWLLVTAPDESLRAPQRALALAKEAVSLVRSPIYLDTLAEAYYVNRSIDKAVETSKEAISLEPEDRTYFKKQLKRFMASAEGG